MKKIVIQGLGFVGSATALAIASKLDKNKLTDLQYKKLNLDQPNHITRLETQVYNKVKGA